MAGNIKMTDEERGVFSFLHGLTGYLVAVALLLTALTVLTICAIKVQKDNATNTYSVDQDIHSLKFRAPSSEQYKAYK